MRYVAAAPSIMSLASMVGVATLVLLAPVTASAADVQANPADYVAKAAALGAGDTLHLAAGDYVDCLTISGMHGSPGQPITITGPQSGAQAVFRGGRCVQPNNPRYSVMIFLEDSSYITIQNLELDAQNMAVSGVRAGFGTTPVHNIVVEGLYIHDNDINNQPSGISCFATAWNWVIRGNRIERTGLGLYLGDSDGTDPFIGGTIERNVVINPKGYGMQIKHQNPRVEVAGMPQGTSVTYVRHNVFIKERNAAVGDDARPNLLVGAFPSTGVGVDDRYEIYGNFLFENQTGTEALFQGEGNVAFHDNVLVNSFGGNGVLIQPHNGLPRVIDIYRNTILTEGIGISISGAESAISQEIRGNAVFSNAMPGIMGGIASENVQDTLLAAADALVDPTPVLGQLDAYPSQPGALQGAALDWSAYADHAAINEDFNSVPRDGTWRGAYAGAGTNPGWELAATVKPSPGNPPPSDAGIADRVTPTPDSGPIGADTGPSPDDAGAPTVDAGLALDSGSGAPDAGPGQPTGTSGGCSSAPSGPMAGLVLLLVGVGALWFRRRA